MKKECNVKLVEFGTVKALVDIVYGDLSIKGFRVIDQEGGKPWVAMPSREYQKNGDRMFVKIVYLADAKKRKKFISWILEEFAKAASN
jgi:DNA-binding cell septation regulator SpoVG